MPPLHLTTSLVLALNFFGWPVIHIGVAWLFLKMPAGLFRFKLTPPTVAIEMPLYEKFFAVRRWKDLLPDGAALFGNTFRKGRLRRRDAVYLTRFILETRRGEAAHWAMLLAAPVFMLWNPAWAVATMFAYAVVANLPCIITQRYNRRRLEQLQMRTPNRVRLAALIPSSACDT